jgi:sugar lactone lactonase YvrE
VIVDPLHVEATHGWNARRYVCVGLLTALLAGGCASLSHAPAATGVVFIDGPTMIAAVGRSLFVDENFGRAVRRIDARTGDSVGVALPPHQAVLALQSTSGQMIVRGINQAWRFDLRTNRLVDAAVPASTRPARSFVARLAPLQAWFGDVSESPDGDAYFTSQSNYAFGRRLWHASLSGALDTIVGPWTHILHDPDIHGHPWYPKSLGSPVLDGHGGLWFLDRGRSMIFRDDLVTGMTTYIAGGTETRAFDVTGSGGPGEFVGLAADEAGSVYAADYGGHRVVRVDPETGKLTTIARVGGAKEQGALDGVAVVDEPDDVQCGPENRAGTFVVHVADNDGGPFPGMEVDVLRDHTITTAIETGTDGNARIDVPESTDVLFVAHAAGIRPVVARFRASRGCTSTVEIPLTFGPTQLHRLF